MKIIRLSYQNLKRNFRSYLSFIFSLSFCTFILYNFLNLMDSGALDVLGEKNKEFSEMIIATVTFVLVFFVFCFIWYASNVFLTQRKKEMGTFVFMGIDNKQLGMMYFFEMMMVGLLSIATGILTGIAFSKMFGMLFFKLSEIDSVISFDFQWITLIKTSLIFLVIYSLLMVKGYVNITRTSVKDMLSATKQSEFKKANGILTLLKAVISFGIICLGYYSALQIGDITSFGYMFLATVCVIVGVYGAYDSLMPYILTKLSDHKDFLYRKQRNLWINHLIFRIKKNYRSYAIVTIMMLCCVSALGAGLAMKQRYEAMNASESQFTYSFYGDAMDKKQIDDTISQYNEIDVKGSSPFFFHIYQEEGFHNDQYAMIISYQDYLSYCKEIGLTPLQSKPKDWQGIELRKKYLLSLANDDLGTIPMDGKEIQLIECSDEPYFGILQYNMDVIIVSDETYQMISNGKVIMELYNTRIKDVNHYKTGMEDVKALTSDHLQVVVSDPNSGEIAFIRVIYSVCIFMFAVFAFSCGGVIFMKTYNDANDDRQRYLILKNMGISQKSLHRSIQCELAFTYVFPIIVTACSSYFIMTALKNLMKSDSLTSIAIISILVLLAYYMILYVISIISFEKRCDIRK